MSEQQVLLESPLREGQKKLERSRRGPVKLVQIDRRQKTMAIIDVEELIPRDHKARAIWHLAGKLDLSRFAETLRGEEGGVGRPAWDPRLLVSIWVYCYSEQISSAREIERLMEYEPGLQWLSGLTVINHHTLSDFRVRHKAALDELFIRLLALLEGAGLISLERLMQDGTKIRAQAGGDSMRRRGTISRRLEQAREVIRQMGDPRQEQSSRREAAQRRAAREQVARLEEALSELAKVENSKHSRQEKQAARASISDPQARVMKDGQGGFAPSYNLQVSTEASHKVIVGVAVTQAASDSGQLLPAMDRIEATLGRQPGQVVADGGYTNRSSIIGMSERGIDFIGSWSDQESRRQARLQACGIAPEFGPAAFVLLEDRNALRCPAGQELDYVRQNRYDDLVYHQYQASAQACESCAYRQYCNPNGGGRIVSLPQEKPEVLAFIAKMQAPPAQQIYQERGAIAEFPHAWIKDKIGLRKFRLRSLLKVRIEALWAALTYNIMQWMRLCWLPLFSHQLEQFQT
jgi:transposase